MKNSESNLLKLRNMYAWEKDRRKKSGLMHQIIRMEKALNGKK